MYELCLKGIGGEISPEEIKNAVNEYLEKNPVKPGATTEQAQQIEQNKTDIASLKTETSSLKEDLSNKITKFYASSQGETHITDSDNGKIMDMMVYGKSEQKQYSGKNLFTFSNDSRDINGVIFEAKDGIITAIGTSTKVFTSTYFQLNYSKDIFTIGETYTFSLNSNDENLLMYALYRENDATDYRPLFSKTTKYATVKIPDNVDLIIRCVVDINTTVNATATIQIEKGSTATSYEPYTGGQHSPSPDYPQEIKSVVNPTVKVCGKNLLDVNLAKANNNVKIHNGVVEQIDSDTRAELQWKIIQRKSNGTIIDYNEVSIMQGTRFGCAFTVVENTTEIVFGLNGEKTDTTVRIPVKLKVGQKYVISCNLLNSTQGSIKWDEMMLEEGSTITDFEPYDEQTVTLPYTSNAIPVSSGGNVTIDGQQYIADYVDVERGKLVKMVDSSKLDNTQSIVDKTEWLLAEPQETDITKEEITALKALATYYPTTNISVNSEQLDGYTVFNYPIPFEDEWIKTKKDVDSLKTRLNDIVGYDNAAAHNAIYRGKNLGTQFTAEMSANIKNGTFKDLYCGDYLVINGTTYRFMDLNYLFKTGDTSLEINHILVVPDAPMYNHVMNDTNTTEGGYVGSKMYTSGLDQALAKIKADFGEAHIVTYRNLLVNTVSNGIPSSWAWYSRQIDLMNEEMVYGTRAWSQATQNGYDTGSNKSQLAAFKHNHSLISSCRSWYWLRAVCSSTYFCGVSSVGDVNNSGASVARGVRPCFLIS